MHAFVILAVFGIGLLTWGIAGRTGHARLSQAGFVLALAAEMVAVAVAISKDPAIFMFLLCMGGILACWYDDPRRRHTVAFGMAMALAALVMVWVGVFILAWPVAVAVVALGCAIFITRRLRI